MWIVFICKQDVKIEMKAIMSIYVDLTNTYGHMFYNICCDWFSQANNLVFDGPKNKNKKTY